MRTYTSEAAAKLSRLESEPWTFTWDGCHKIYVLDCPQAHTEAREAGYDVELPMSELRDVIERSCSLVFVARWALAGEGPDAFYPDYGIRQFEIFEDET